MSPSGSAASKPGMQPPILLDLSHTSHTRARTGVQRVVRAIRRELPAATSICFDPFEGAWRPLEAWEERNLDSPDSATGRGAKWPLSARLRGRLRRGQDRSQRLGVSNGSDGPPQAGVIVPEIFSPEVAGALPLLFGMAVGPRVALFHDAIALQFPEYSPRATVARFPGYLRQLLVFDGIAANSAASRDVLVGYWRWLGVTATPPVEVIPLGIDPTPTTTSDAGQHGIPTVLCVGTIEGRKNHVALLEGCEILWSRGLGFRLRLVGLANSETGATALELIARMKAAGRPLSYDGPVGDQELDAAYRQCAFTVYPSLAEGFGLPVAESLSRGKPCICSSQGALGEIARGGGCVELQSLGAAAIAEAIGRLIEAPQDLSALAASARARRFGTWSEYARHLTGWMATIRRRA
jgi:glycosyltransferase involved in cell wall biosynthesis